MSKIENAVSIMLDWANDPAHGYDQSARWGPDYDCSSAIISALEKSGIPVKTNGATYTGNMYSAFMRTGFEDVTALVNLANGSGLQRGDVLLNHVNHTAMYIGNGETVEASINEFGGTTGGMTGDQTGREFLTRAYRDYPWDVVLRYTGNGSEGAAGSVSTGNKTPTYFYSVKLPLLKRGHEGDYVETLQHHLTRYGLLEGAVDGIFGRNTEEAVVSFQALMGLETDGEVGGLTWAALLGG